MPKPISILPKQSLDKLPFREFGIRNIKISDEAGKFRVSVGFQNDACDVFECRL
jgi:hypothetical protein